MTELFFVPAFGCMSGYLVIVRCLQVLHYCQILLIKCEIMGTFKCQNVNYNDLFKNSSVCVVLSYIMSNVSLNAKNYSSSRSLTFLM